jgi:hypothetical protein
MSPSSFLAFEWSDWFSKCLMWVPPTKQFYPASFLATSYLANHHGAQQHQSPLRLAWLTGSVQETGIWESLDLTSSVFPKVRETLLDPHSTWSPSQPRSTSRLLEHSHQPNHWTWRVSKCKPCS